MSDYEPISKGSSDNAPKSFYCPYCKRTIEPEMVTERSAVYVHDDIDHPNNFNMSDYLVMH